MGGYRVNIEKLTKKNNNYRKVLFTADNDLQLTVMSLRPKEEIGKETHSNLAQFVRVESGVGKAIIGKKTYLLSDGVVVIIPRNVEHNIVNTSKSKDLKIYVIYTAKEHPLKLIERTKPSV